MLGTSYKEIFDRNTKTTKIIDGTELIKEELNFLLQVEKYTLLGGNGLGLDLQKYMSLQSSTAIFNLIRLDLEELFNKYGKANLDKVSIDFKETELQITLDCSTTSGDTFILGLAIGSGGTN